MQNYHCGDSELILNLDDFKSVPKEISVTSSQFTDDGFLPVSAGAHRCNGQEQSPEVSAKVPANEEVKSVVLIIQDIDVPVPHPINHGTFYGINPSKDGSIHFANGVLTDEYANETKEFKVAYGSLSRVGYLGCGPPPLHGAHRYVFQFFAVNSAATEALEKIEARPYADDVVKIIAGNTIYTGSITGKFQMD